MPLVAFIGVASQPQDMEQIARLRGAASGYPDQVLRVIRFFVNFTAANPDLQGPGKRRLATQRFLGQALSAKRSASTVRNWAQALQKFRVDADCPEIAIERVEDYRFMNGLKRLAAARTSATSKTAYPLETLAMFCQDRVLEGPDQQRRHLEFRCFWFLLLCTGNRPDNVCRASVVVEDDRVVMRWRNRKERAGGHAGVAYPFAWSIRPQEDIVARLSRLQAEPWLFNDPRNVAGAVNRWLTMEIFARGEDFKLTTGATRCRLSTLLRYKVEVTKEMTESHFEDVMDHKVVTSRKHYATETLM